MTYTQSSMFIKMLNFNQYLVKHSKNEIVLSCMKIIKKDPIERNKLVSQMLHIEKNTA